MSMTAQRIATSSTLFQSVSPATVNNLLNVVTDTVQQAHHYHQPVQLDGPFACTAKISPVSVKHIFEHNLTISNGTFLEQCSIA